MSPLLPFEVSGALEGEMDKGGVREFCHHYQIPPTNTILIPELSMIIPDYTYPHRF